MNSPLTNKLLLLILWMFVFLPQSVIAETAKPIELPLTQPAVPELPATSSTNNTPSGPVWQTLKTEDLSIPENKKPDEGFAQAPPSTKKIVIRASASSVARGDSITFSLDNVAGDVRYFWLIDQQKSTSSEFVVDTSPLNPGKHRVRVTVTDKDKNQKHSAAFFTVEKREFDENEAGEANKDENTETAENEIDQTTQDVETDSKELRIEPAILRVKPGEVATFISSKNSVDGYSFEWTFQDRQSIEEQFEIITSGVEPGSYPIRLRARSAEEETSTATASLVILSESEQNKTMPDLRGITIDSLDQQLNENGLIKGTIKTQPSIDSVGIVILQSPSAGERVEEGATVDLTIGVAADATVPSLLGLTRGGAQDAIEKSGFTMGEVTEKPVENQIGLVVEQQPKSGVSINTGAAVDIGIGVPIENTNKNNLVIKIEPAAAVVVQGDELRYLFNDVISGEHIVKWKLDDQEARGPAFNVNTDDLKAGEYMVTAEVFLDDQVVAKDSAKLIINAKRIIMPYLTDMTLEEAQERLAEIGLKVATVEKREAAISEPRVIHHTPEYGQKVSPDTEITLTVVVPEEKPDITLAVTSDKVEARVGETITFTSALAGLEDTSDVHYVYKINSQKKANIQPELTWTPEAEGIYSVITSAFNDTGLIAESTPISIRVGNAWEAPKAMITPEIISTTQGERVEFVSTSTYDVNTTLEYRWHSETGHSGSKKQFSFDTTDIPAGTYEVTLSVTDGEGNINETSSNLAITAKDTEESAAAIPGSDNLTPDTDTVAGTSLFNQDQPVSLTIESSRQFASVEDEVRFNIIANPSGDYRYYFKTQDEDDSGWTDATSYTHKFTDYGTYRVVAALKNGEKVIYSDGVTIWVWSKGLFILIGGIGLSLLLLLMWWSRRSIPDDKPSTTEANLRTSPVVDASIDDIESDEKLISEATKPLDDNDIHTEKRTADEDTVSSVLMKALFQFILGLALSVVIIYIIVKSIS